MSTMSSLELRTKITSEARLELWLEQVTVPKPAADEVVVRIDAAPLNPSDIILLLGPVDPVDIEAGGTPTRPTASANIPLARMPGLEARLDIALPAGNEGAGVVVDAGSHVGALVGRTVAARSPLGMYAQYRVVKASDCLVLPDGISARQGASAIINPLTVLGMVETMRREGHSALVHTAAASNVGRMLNRVCLTEGIRLVNIVRSPAQAEALRLLGARHVLDSSSPTFRRNLVGALEETGATLAFDAIGGGTMAGTIVAAMEEALGAKAANFSRYGSPIHKQVYIYGMLSPGPRILEGNLGMAWSVGGWLMTWFYGKIDSATAQRLRDRVTNELTTTFASHYTSEISLADALSPEIIAAYSRRATGEKFLMLPNG
ncbi:MAG: oxidoreductase [Gammaproteobacteria bacterium]|nr:oxidoreductase [Gammaproteobacteria bacterium]